MDQPNLNNPLDKAFVNFKVVESRIEEATSLWMAASYGKVWLIEALFKKKLQYQLFSSLRRSRSR
jgi:hypothetical protein